VSSRLIGREESCNEEKQRLVKKVSSDDWNKAKDFTMAVDIGQGPKSSTRKTRPANDRRGRKGEGDLGNADKKSTKKQMRGGKGNWSALPIEKKKKKG